MIKLDKIDKKKVIFQCSKIDQGHPTNWKSLIQKKKEQEKIEKKNLSNIISEEWVHGILASFPTPLFSSIKKIVLADREGHENQKIHARRG